MVCEFKTATTVNHKFLLTISAVFSEIALVVLLYSKEICYFEGLNNLSAL